MSVQYESDRFSPTSIDLPPSIEPDSGQLAKVISIHRNSAVPAVAANFPIDDIRQGSTPVADVGAANTASAPVPSAEEVSASIKEAQRLSDALKRPRVSLKRPIPQPDAGYNPGFYDQLDAISAMPAGTDRDAMLLLAEAADKQRTQQRKDQVRAASQAKIQTTPATVANMPSVAPLAATMPDTAPAVQPLLPAKTPVTAPSRTAPQAQKPPVQAGEQPATPVTPAVQAAEKLSRKERRSAQLAAREKAWLETRETHAEKEFQGIHMQALNRQASEVAFADEIITPESIEIAQEGILFAAQSRASKLKQGYRRQLILDDAQAEMAAYPDEVPAKREAILASLEVTDPLAAAILNHSAAMKLTRANYAIAVAATRGSSLKRNQVGGEAGYANGADQRGRTARMLGRFGIGQVPLESGAALDAQFDYEVQTSVLEKLIRQHVAETNPDASPEDKKRLQNEAVLSRMLIDGWTDRNGDKQLPELFELNNEVAERRKLDSGEFIKSRTQNGFTVAIDKNASNPLGVREKIAMRTHKAYVGVLNKWNAWSHQGRKGVAKKAVAGLAMAGVGAMAGAAGAAVAAPTIGVGLAFGTGMAVRLSRLATISKLEKGSDRIQAEHDADGLADMYSRWADNYKGAAVDNDPQVFDMHEFRQALNQDFTYEAQKQARKNRTRLVLGAVGVGGTLLSGVAVEGATHVVERVMHLFSIGNSNIHEHVTAVARPPIVNHMGGKLDMTQASNHQPGAGSSVGTKDPIIPRAAPPKTTPGAAGPVQAVPKTISMADLKGQYVSGIYNQAGMGGFAQMQADAQAAIANGNLIQVHNGDDWYYALTGKGAKAIGGSRGSSSTADVMRVMAKASGKFRIAA